VSEEKEDRENVANKTSEPQSNSADEADNSTDDESGDEHAEHDHEHSAEGSNPARRQMKLWIAIGVGVVIAVLLVMKGGQSSQSGPPLAAVGSTVTGDLTLVNADRNELECMAQDGLKDYQCGFIDDKQTRQLQEGNKLRPFMTVDRTLYLIPGLFLEPSITQRYNSEPAGKPRGEQKRFTAKCTIKIVGELANVKLRWAPEGTWEAPKKFSVATVSDCKIEG
jgi:hypothetical protein